MIILSLVLCTGFTTGDEGFDAELTDLIFPVLSHSMSQTHGEGVYLDKSSYEITDVSAQENYYVVSVEIMPYNELYPAVSRDEAVLHVSETGIGVLNYRVLEDFQET